MWHAGLMGGGDDWYNVVLVTAPVGSEIEFDDGDEVVTAIGTGSQQAIAIHDPSSTYNITVSVNGYQETDTVTSTAVSGTVFIKEFKFAKITLTFDDDFRGLAVTLTDGTHVASPAPTLPATGNTADFYVPYYEVTYTFSATVSGIPYTSKGVYVDSLDDECTETLNVRPDGKTVTPTDDIQTWLECAGIDKPYTTLDEVLGDHESLQILMTDHNAVDYMVRSKSWIKQISVPKMTSNTAPYGEAFMDVGNTSNPNPAYYAFDGQVSYVQGWKCNNAVIDPYVGYKFPSPVIINRAKISTALETDGAYQPRLKGIVIQGSNTSSSTGYVDLYTGDFPYDPDLKTDTNTIEIDIPNTTPYQYYRLVCKTSYRNMWYSVCELQFYSLDADHGITEDETAMRYIGRRNYASDRLLGLDNPGLVPVLSSDDGNIIKSSEISGGTYDAYMAFDGDKSTAWAASTNTFPQYIGYDFGTPRVVQNCRIRKRVYSSGAGNLTGRIEASNDGVNYDDLTGEITWNAIVTAESESMWNDISFNNSTAYQYYRVYITSGVYPSASEIQFYAESFEWADAIYDSTYFKSVLNVKNAIMTSNTTPSGYKASASGEYQTNYAWKAFDEDINTYWYHSTTGSCWLEYEFPDPINVKAIKTLVASAGGSSAWTRTYQYYDDSSGQWITFTNGVCIKSLANGKVLDDVIVNGEDVIASRFRVYITDGYALVHEMGIYAREDVDESKVMLYGANQDSFYYKDSGQQDVPLTTLSTTEKEISKSDLPLGEFKLYSSVAKNPDDLTADFCKTFKNDDNLIEVMMRPENALYWYGYKDPAELINITSYGTNDGHCVFYDGTQYATLKQASGSSHSRISIYDKPLKNNQNFWVKAINRTSANGTDKLRQRYIGTNDLSNIIYPAIRGAYGYNGNIYRTAAYLNSKSSFEPHIDNCSFDDTSGVTTDYQMRAFWHAFPNPACNLFSAAKDVVYYTENGVDIVVAETDEFGGAIVDFSKIPAGVTLYSSVAKDPDDPNLTDPYSKTFSPVNGRFWLMPDNTLYWYGYMSDNLESCTAANGWIMWSGGSLIAPAYSVNNITISASSENACGVGSSRRIDNIGNIHVIGKGISGTHNNYYNFVGCNPKDVQDSAGLGEWGLCTSTSMQHLTADGSLANGNYVRIMSYKSTSEIYAFWLE